MERLAATNAPGVYKPRIAFASGDTAWVVWHQPDHNIWYAVGTDGVWPAGKKIPVSFSHTFFSPEIACGGGEVWLTWYGDRGQDGSDVFATQWTGSDWEPVLNLTGDTPGYHWFSDIAVDSHGKAHLVWGDSDSRLINYRTKEAGGEWSTTEALNPIRPLGRGSVLAYGWPMCHIEVDRSDIVHVVWVGRAVDEDGRPSDGDVYYSTRVDGQWSAPLRINPEDDADAFYPEIAVGETNDVWFAWSNGSMMGGTGGIFAAHHDGVQVSTQQRLDTGYYTYNGVPRVVLDGEDSPWVFWGASQVGGADASAILYSRFLSGSSRPPVVFEGLACDPRPGAVDITWRADHRWFETFSVERSDGGEFLEQARIEVGSNELHSWADRGVGAGTHAYRVVGFLIDGDTLTLGPVEVQGETVVFADLKLRPVPGAVDLQWTADPTVFSEFAIVRSDSGVGAERARVQAGTGLQHSWRDVDVAEGTHTYRIDGYLEEGGVLCLGPADVQVEAGLRRLVILPVLAFAPGGMDIQVGLPEPGSLAMGLYDLQGRVIETLPPTYLDQGWHSLRLQPRGRSLANGIYFLRATSGTQQVVARVAVVH